MEYLTNEKLLKQQQLSSLFSLGNSRSSSVTRFAVPSTRNTHDPHLPLRSNDLFNRLEDILKSKQVPSTTYRKKSKQSSCFLHSFTNNKYDHSREETRKMISNIDNSTSKTPNEPAPFLNVYTDHQPKVMLPGSFVRRKSQVNYLQLQETDHKNKQRSNLKKFKDEFTQMQAKINSRNNSVADFKINTNEVEQDKCTLKKLNTQLQEQNQSLHDQLIHEKKQNDKLNALIKNLNSQIETLNQQIENIQLEKKKDGFYKEAQLLEQKTQYEQLTSQLKKQNDKIKQLQQENQMFQKIQSEMQQLEELCQSFSSIGCYVTKHNQLTNELRDLFKVQHNIIEKVINKTDFPIDQLLINKKQEKTTLPLLDQVIQSNDILQEVNKQLKSQIETLTQRFIQDLLI